MRVRLSISLGLAVWLAAGSATASTPPVTGLGQSWPNTTDASANPGYHVYVFQRLGVRYVQVNDASGGVRGAIAYDGKSIGGLPVGTDASHWVTPTEGTYVPSRMANGVTVYSDDVMTITVAVQPDGSMLMSAAPVDCHGDPAECSLKNPLVPSSP
ncbi:MAG: hypothetical protein GAK28_03916 [Luteibacter sp.]|uniref:hypothetical protein n=1 Tax=Luteibacter sp. TaxID=1886636 RepID=UPI001382F7E0|nr:hypothetical protein [Luteibacter sp.]KAF1004539.1 MAG: hypothetical protein GAK28_03916 [Luteibacter sp.]